MGDSTEFTGVKADRPVIEEGTYDATVAGFSDLKQGGFGDPYVLWLFHPDGYPDDFEVAGATSVTAGATAKGMEWARRILGKSTATDMKWGRDLKEKRPIINWGPPELTGKPCRIVVEKNYDEDEERHRNRVVNVLPPETTEAEKSLKEDEGGFDSLDF
jgi:hypothetical protein